MSGEDRRLTLSSLTLGDAGFKERVRTAAEAGFHGIGLSMEVYLAALRNGLDDRTMSAILEDHGVLVTEVDFASDWILEPGLDKSARVKETTLLHMARTFGAERLHAGPFDRVPLDSAVRGFAALCDRVGPLRVALEFMPFGDIPDLKAAWEIVLRSQRQNGGLLLDVWPWVRVDSKDTDILAIERDRAFALQLCDVSSKPLEEQRHESLHLRLPPSSGTAARHLVGLVRDFEAKPAMCVEVISDELTSRGPRIQQRR